MQAQATPQSPSIDAEAAYADLARQLGLALGDVIKAQHVIAQCELVIGDQNDRIRYLESLQPEETASGDNA